MTMPTPSDQELHAYADGQLDAERRREVERYLADHPDAAREVDAVRRQTDELRRQHADLGRFAPPPRLDPARIRLAQAARRRRAMALAASLVLTLGLGSVGGWQIRDAALRASYLPMADAVQAYRMFASDAASSMVDFRSSQPAELQAWLNRHFVQPAPLPDFDAFGFQPVGARLMSSEYGPAAMVLYQNPAGESVLYYVRPPGGVVNFGDGKRRDGDLTAQYWKQGRYFYGVVSPSDTPAARAVQQAVAPDA